MVSNIDRTTSVRHTDLTSRIFLLEGIVTVMLGVSCFFLLIDSPALSGRWLKPDEIRFLELQRFIKDGGKFSDEKEPGFKWNDLKMVLCNWRLYMQAYILLCISACSYGKYNGTLAITCANFK